MGFTKRIYESFLNSAIVKFSPFLQREEILFSKYDVYLFISVSFWL